jgi:protein-disulfide isomerase
MDNLVAHYREDLRAVFRAYSVPGFPHGERAIDAALAAARQGKFWEMHRRLFAGGSLERPLLRAHAEAIGLDMARFLDDLDAGSGAAVRLRHRRQALQLGIQGLPAVFVNGMFVMGFHEEADYRALVEDEMRRARTLMRDGTPRAELYAAFMQGASLLPVKELDRAKELRKELVGRKAPDDLDPRSLVEPSPEQRYRVPVEDAPARGPADAPVLLVEFVDFQCPFCKRFAREVLGELLRRYPADLSLVVRHLPIAGHEAADGMARAAVAAGRQGRFWDFHDRLFALDGAIGRSAFLEIAGSLGMDEARFLADIDAPATHELVRRDLDLARRLGVTGTPSFFVNGRYVSGFRGIDEIAALVDEELRAAKKRMRAGTPRGRVREDLMAGAVPEAEFPNPGIATPVPGSLR